MQTLLRLEEAALAALAVWLFVRLDVAWWWLAVFFLAPDLSMLGYLAGPRAGALLYNLAHHQGVAVVLYLAGALVASTTLQAAGLILLAHSSVDRILGYGLKYSDSFQHTHLGWIGRRRDATGIPPATKVGES